MSQKQFKTQPAAQAGSPGETAAEGAEVGGVHSNPELEWLDLHALNAETRAYLKERRRDPACTHACPRSEGQHTWRCSYSRNHPRLYTRVSTERRTGGWFRGIGNKNSRQNSEAPTHALSQSQSGTEIPVLESLRRHPAPGLIGTCVPTGFPERKSTRSGWPDCGNHLRHGPNTPAMAG